MSFYRCEEVDGTSGTLQKGGTGVAAKIYAINVCTAAASAVCTVYQGTSSSGTVRATIDASAKGCYILNATFPQGFYIAVTGGAAKVSVSYE